MRKIITGGAIRTAIKAVFIALLLMGPSALRADDSISMSLEELLNTPIEAASMMKEKPLDSAAAAHVITEETIKIRGYSNLLDLLEDIPQYEIQHMSSERRGNDLTARGVFENERIIIMIDGVRVTPPTGNLYALGRQFSLKNARQVEIIMGPMSALYGADAFSGVINIVTKKGDELEGVIISPSYGNYKARDVSAVFGKSLETIPYGQAKLLDDAAISFTVHSYQSEGANLANHYDKDFSWHNNEYQQGRVRESPYNSNLKPFQPRPWSDDTGADFMHGRLNLKNWELGMIRMTEEHSSSYGVKPEFSPYIKEAVFKTNYNTVYARQTYFSDDNKVKMVTTLSNYFYEIDPKSRFINNFTLYDDAYKYGRDHSYSLNWRLAYDVSEVSNLLIGVTHDSHSSLPYSADLLKPFDSDKSVAEQNFIYPGSDLSTHTPQGIEQDFHSLYYRNTGGYAQWRLKEWEDINLTLGARYDRNTRYGDSFNSRAALTWKASEKTSFKALYGEAFLSPAPDKTHLHFGSFEYSTITANGLISQFFALPNPDLKPEKLRSAEASVSHHINDSIWLSANFYQTKISHLIRDINHTEATTFKGITILKWDKPENRGTAKSYGGTLRFDGLWNMKILRLSAYSAYTYSYGETAGKNFLPYSARHTVHAGVGIKKGKWSISPRMIWRSPSYIDMSALKEGSPAFAVVNLYAACNGIISGATKLSAFLDIKNLTNARYYNAGHSVGTVGFTATPQEPIRISGGIKFEF
ncbi:MAG: TonB-dependent receptor [Elusimicrobiota bacterium]|nr:TonB-dependent receptor [Elusimicrobiota bacterium]